MTIRDELLALHDEQGLCRPKEAVAWARANKHSALYSSLEWDDSKAAEAHRIWQVRQLIAIHIVSEGGRRQLVSLSIDRQQLGGGYRTLESISEVKEFRDVLLQDAFDELTRVRIRYEDLQELAKVWYEIDKAKAKGGNKKKAKHRVARRSNTEPSRPSAA